MAQRSVFKMPIKGKRKDDEALIENSKRKTIGSIKYTATDKVREASVRAKSMSERILGDVLDRLELVTDLERFKEYTKKMAKFGMGSLDMETGGLDPMHDITAGLCLYFPGETGIYVPVGHISSFTHELVPGQLTKEEVAKQLKFLVRKKVKLVYHHAKFDLKAVYYGFGVDMGAPYWDTQIGSTMLNENEPHGLKVLHAKYVVGEENKELAKFNKLFGGIQIPQMPLDVAFMYSAYDPIQTWELFKFQEPYLTQGTTENIEFGLEKVAWLFREVETPFTYVLFKAERRGICINNEYLTSLREIYKDKLNDAQSDCNVIISKYRNELIDLKLANPDLKIDVDYVNMASDKQVAILLYDLFGLKSADKKKPRGTGEPAIHNMEHEIIEPLLRHRKYSKLITTYLTMDKHVSPLDNRVHTSYKQNGARTGRISSVDPNLQNIPARGEGSEIRQVFIPGEGFVFISSDYSQQEPRVLAFLAQDEQMIEAYKRGQDLYAFLASINYKVPYEDCLEFFPDGTRNKDGKVRRNSMKEILLGLMYGRETKSIATKLNISVKEAEKLTRLFFETFPKIRDHIIAVQQHAIDYGYVQTAGGRKCRLPDMQLPIYEITPVEGAKNANFDAFDFSEDGIEVDDTVPEHVIEKYYALLDNTWKWSDKQRIMQDAEEEGYHIRDNTWKLAEVERKCLNSQIQGR